MRAFGICILIAGLVGMLAAMNMDVSVWSGLGKVSNLELLAKRQMFTTVAGVVALGGLLIALLGGQARALREGTAMQEDEHHCPFCAEPINPAAVKCKHCGETVEPKAESAISVSISSGWTVRYDCADDLSLGQIKSQLTAMSVPSITTDGMTVVAGFFPSQQSASGFCKKFSAKHGVEGHIYFPSPA